jgi:hypothetical protein
MTKSHSGTFRRRVKRKRRSGVARNEYMEELCHVCKRLDEIIEKFETPVINENLNNLEP